MTGRTGCAAALLALAAGCGGSPPGDGAAARAGTSGGAEEYGRVLADYGAIPEFSFRDRHGRPFASADLQGKVWIVDFVFTRCYGPCPEMTRKLKQLSEQLAGEERVGFLSFTVDPEYDTEEVLSEYAERFGATSERWYWVRGEKNDTFQLTQEGFLQPLVDATETAPINHSTRFVILDGRGHMRSWRDTRVDPDYNPDPLGAVLADVEVLLAEADGASPGNS